MQVMLTLILIYVQYLQNVVFSFEKSSNGHKKPPAKFPIAPTGEIPLPLNAISKTLNFPFAQKEDFLRKLTNISITFIYLLFSSMLTCFIKNP